MTETRYEIVTTQERLQELTFRWRNCDALMLDTEFVRTNTYSARIGLLQIGDRDGNYLLDPLALQSLHPLAETFNPGQLTTVLHAGSEDLEVLTRELSGLPPRLVDTQTGAGLAGLDRSMSFQKLVEHCTGEVLPKGESRSDWLKRPLTESQLEYAALDVAWLAPVYEQLRDKLEELGRLHWWYEDGAYDCKMAGVPPTVRALMERIKGASQLDAPSQARLGGLVLWRERLASERDRPRGWILADTCCLELARHVPASLAALGDVPELAPATVRRYGEALLELLHQPGTPVSLPPALTGAGRKHLKSMKAMVSAHGKTLGIDPTLLASNRELDGVLRYGEHPEWPLRCLQGWRRDLIGEQLLEMREVAQ